MKKLDYRKVENRIVSWMSDYLKSSGQKGWVVGVSGGVDSATVSTLAAKTGAPVIVLELPIHQSKSEVNRAKEHIKWLKENYDNVRSLEIDLTLAFDTHVRVLSDALRSDGFSEDQIDEMKQNLCSANLRSRHRMETLYHFAGLYGYLVVGTGNKVEDYGIGFCTKGGDSCCDISPIGDLMKSEVRALARHMGVKPSLTEAVATDGLWDSGATDEDQIGASYDELEWAMDWLDPEKNTAPDKLTPLTERQQEVLRIYTRRHKANKHKMSMPPICEIKNLR